MQKYKAVILLGVLFLSLYTPLTVYGATGSVTCLPQTVKEGEKTTITIAVTFSENSAFKFNLVSDNATVVTTPLLNYHSYADFPTGTKSAIYNVDITANQAGQANLVVIGADAATFPSDSSRNPESVILTGNCPITVVKAETGSQQTTPTEQTTPSNQSNTQTTPKNDNVQKQPVVKSGNANLASLSISEGKLEPEFSYDVKEYVVNLESTVKKLNIEATKAHSSAKVSGLGEIELSAGDNKHTITVTAENGAKNYYSINFKVAAEIPTLTFQDKKYQVITELDEINLPGYTKTPIKLGVGEVIAFKGNQETLLYLADERDHKAFYIFDESAEQIVDKLQYVSFNEHYFKIVKPALNSFDSLIAATLTIQGHTISAYRFEDPQLNHLAIIYLQPFNGVKNYYLYDQNMDSVVLVGEYTLINNDERLRLSLPDTTVKESPLKESLLWLGISLVSMVALILAIILFKYKRHDAYLEQQEETWDWSDPIREEKLKEQDQNKDLEQE